MGQILATQLSPGSTPLPESGGAKDPAIRRALVSAVTALNQAGVAGDGREIRFGVNPSTHELIIRVVDVNTGETITQLPGEDTLRIASQYRERPKGNQ